MVSASWKKAAPTVLTALYWILALLYWESLLHAAVFGGFGMDYWYAAGFSVSLGALPALAVSFLKKGRFAGNVILTLVLAVLYGSQLVYNSIFGTLYSAAMMAQGGGLRTVKERGLLPTVKERSCLRKNGRILSPRITTPVPKKYLPDLARCMLPTSAFRKISIATSTVPHSLCMTR